MRLTRRKFIDSTLKGSALAALPAAFSSCSVSSRAGTVAPARPGPSQFKSPPDFTFPKGFFWGATTSSYQIEGAWNDDGKGESIWDRFVHTSGKIKHGDTGDVACDSYHRWDEDVALMRALNLNSYRFSLSWPRIQPNGSGTANIRGIDYYSRLVDVLLEARIRPFITLYHWDLPQSLEDAGGWPMRDTALRFADYVQLAARAFGDRVSDWTLFNEPNAFVALGYLEGMHAPGRKGLLDFLRAAHVVNLAQGAGFRALKAELPKARVGTTYWMSPCEPASDSAEDQLAADRAHAIVNTWFLEPALRGRYPDALAFFPEGAMGIRPGDMEQIRAPLDFIGINVYTRTIASAVTALERLTNTQQWLFPVKMQGGEVGPKTDLGWEVWPKALYDIVMRITRDYNRPVIELTESGCAYNDAPDGGGEIHDERRISYHREYISAMARAIVEGADMRSYHAWSLMDNFEWAEGYGQRFGLSYVDFNSQQRTIKDSGKWFAKVAQENRI